ncbi:hypothetical protein [Nocardia sp. NPDC057227]
MQNAVNGIFLDRRGALTQRLLGEGACHGMRATLAGAAAADAAPDDGR